MTFGGYPITFEYINGDVLVTCKGVTGSLSQAKNFLKPKGGIVQHYFGTSKIYNRPNKMVRIDCLEDTRKQFLFIYKQAELFKNECNKRINRENDPRPTN